MRPSPRRTRALVGAATMALVTAGLPTWWAGAAQPRIVVAAAATLPPASTVLLGSHATTFDVVLKSRDAAGEAAFLQALSTPGAPEYRHFLTPAAFAQRFGAPSQAIATVRAYLAQHGLHPDALSRGGVTLKVSGATTTIGQVFHARVATVRTAGGSVESAFTSPATLPASIASDVSAVAGMSAASPFTSNLVLARTTPSTSSTPQTCSHVGAATGTEPNNNGFTVQQQAAMYGLATQWHNGNTGKGAVIALYELGLADMTDTATFFSCYGISPKITTIKVDGGATPSFTREATMDIEEAASLAPGATIDVYSAPNAGAAPIDLYTQIADDDKATVVSTSWGDCETDPNGTISAETPVMQQLAAEGITVVAAAGDQGSSDCTGITNNLPAVDDPASQPLVTGVGGLTVNNYSPLNETVWNNSGSASGGGISTVWSRPSWQEGSLFTNDTSQGVATAKGRMVPDLSVMGDPMTGFIEYFTGTKSGTVICKTSVCTNGWSGVGGTSIGSPLVASLVAVAAQACGVSRLGFLNPTLYSLGTKDFIPITTGSNDLFAQHKYNAGPGYNLAAGLGSPTSSLIPDLCPSAVDPLTSTLSTPATTIVTGASTPFTLALHTTTGVAMADAIVTLKVAGPSGAPTLDGDPTTTSGSGAALLTTTTNATGTTSFSLTTNAAGTFTVTATVGSVTAATTTVTVVSAKSVDVPPARPVVRVLARSANVAIIAVSLTNGLYPATSLEISTNGGASWSVVPVAAHVTVRHLLARHLYHLIVRALNKWGASPWSAAVALRTLA